MQQPVNPDQVMLFVLTKFNATPQTPLSLGGVNWWLEQGEIVKSHGAINQNEFQTSINAILTPFWTEFVAFLGVA